MNHNFLQNVARKQKDKRGHEKEQKGQRPLSNLWRPFFSMYWLFLDIWSNQAISLPGTCVKGYNLTLSVPLYCFLSPFLCPMYGGPGNTHVECLEPLVTNQQLIKKFPYTSRDETKVSGQELSNYRYCMHRGKSAMGLLRKQDKVSVIHFWKQTVAETALQNTFDFSGLTANLCKFYLGKIILLNA